MFAMRRKLLVGIDIGTHSIKVVRLKQKGKGYQLLNFGAHAAATGSRLSTATLPRLKLSSRPSAISCGWKKLKPKRSRQRSLGSR